MVIPDDSARTERIGRVVASGPAQQNIYARFEDFLGQIADIDLSTWSTNIKTMKISKIIRIEFQIFSDVHDA